MAEIVYIYPISIASKMISSFTLLAKYHLKYLRQVSKVYELDRDKVSWLYWATKKNVLIHPICDTFIGGDERRTVINKIRLEQVFKYKNRIGGFDIADSSEISKVAVKVLNRFDLVMVPSSYAEYVFRNSGVTTPIGVVPHGINPALYEPDTHPDELLPSIKPLWDVKQKTDSLFVLFFAIQNLYRKSAEIVANVMHELQFRTGRHSSKQGKRTVLLVKAGFNPSPDLRIFEKLKRIVVTGFMSDAELKQLYDISNVVVVPSKGGGFELNALEAIARGVPTLVTGEPAWRDYPTTPFHDYLQFTVPLTVSEMVRVYDNHPVHTGKGWAVSEREFYRTLVNVLDNPDDYKKQFAEHRKKVLEIYHWDRIGERLISLLREYDFI
ncbi:MAG: Glycosyl transferases group 1 [Candidatus Bathyarchaeota archaeon BA2]|nr:MAG: Glycosyl transferases group 1 [Candidatus Bathyarchaeota archaeon BA2]